MPRRLQIQGKFGCQSPITYLPTGVFGFAGDQEVKIQGWEWFVLRGYSLLIFHFPHIRACSSRAPVNVSEVDRNYACVWLLLTRSFRGTETSFENARVGGIQMSMLLWLFN